MSQNSENDSDDDVEYFLQPVSNQYNITEKIKEANQQLYKVESVTRSSQPKVRFRDHQLVDYEPEEDDATEVMEKRTNSSNSVKKEEESSDDGYIDDEVLEIVPTDESRVIVESIEIEEVCEQIEVLEMSAEVNNIIVNDAFESEASEEDNYARDEFHEDVQEEQVAKESPCEKAIIKAEEKKRKTSNSATTATAFSTKKIFRTKINPSDDMAAVKEVKSTQRKKCCQYKETDEYKQKLPKYNGLNSNYGLSKEEFERRQLRQLENVELKQQRRQHTVQQKEHLAQTNEAAFAKWLCKKMRNPINKSNPVNMYDTRTNSKRQNYQQQRRRQIIQRQMETEECEDETAEEEEYES